MADAVEKRAELTRLLSERGVGGASVIVEQEFSDTDLPGAFATVNYFDDQDPSRQNSGLLLFLLRSGEKAAYRRPHERKSEGAVGEVTPLLLRSIRGSCNSPNGFTREEARGMLAVKAQRMRVTPDSLIDAAMGKDWMESPVHPALSRAGSSSERFVRYARWVAGEEPAA